MGDSELLDMVGKQMHYEVPKPKIELYRGHQLDDQPWVREEQEEEEHFEWQEETNDNTDSERTVNRKSHPLPHEKKG